MAEICSNSSNSLKGSIAVPGDKSISHRAVIIGTLAVGETIIYGLLEGEDVLATVNAMRQLGADISKNTDKNGAAWSVYGRGIGGLVEPDTTINLGNSGTAARLISGIIASHNIKATLIGDPSLSSRPMDRVLEPLQNIGAQCLATAKNRNGDHDEALQILDDLYFSNKNNDEVNLAISNYYASFDENKKAIDILEKFLRRNPVNIKVMNQLANLYWINGDKEKAIAL